MQLLIHNKQKLTLEIHINYILKTFLIFFFSPYRANTQRIPVSAISFPPAANIPTA